MNKDDSLNGNCIGGYYKLHGFLLYMFTKRSAQLTTSGGSILFVLRFYQPLFFSYALRWQFFAFYVFTNLSTSPTTSGGSIFRCTTKDRGERRAKGVATPFNPPELMQDIILTCFVRTVSQWCN